MKQVNVLMEESLLEHLERLSQMISLFCDKKITVSDIVRKSVVKYSKYKQVVIESKLLENKKFEIEVKSVGMGDELVSIKQWQCDFK
jgi:hypothetical protein